jgi:hypothetical protein
MPDDEEEKRIEKKVEEKVEEQLFKTNVLRQITNLFKILNKKKTEKEEILGKITDLDKSTAEMFESTESDINDLKKRMLKVEIHFKIWAGVVTALLVLFNLIVTVYKLFF